MAMTGNPRQMDHRPLIGISTAMERARWTVWDREAFLLATSYVEEVERAGGLAVMLPPGAAAPEHAERIVESLDGLLLSGGTDIDPAAYGEERHPCVTHTSPARDEFEAALVHAALERGVPLLGICRGMQMLNVALGGTLHQHLPDEIGHTDHRRSLGSFDNADHDVRIAPGSLAHRIIEEELHSTKSHHHQGVDQLGEDLVPSAWSTLDELVEAIELPDRWALGVQWHPEVDADSPVVAGLVGEARKKTPAYTF
jgi:putative glutamine amidotransferase